MEVDLRPLHREMPSPPYNAFISSCQKWLDMVEVYRAPSYCFQLPSPDGHPASLKLTDCFLLLVSLSGTGFSIAFLHNITVSGQTYMAGWCLLTL